MVRSICFGAVLIRGGFMDIYHSLAYWRKVMMEMSGDERGVRSLSERFSDEYDPDEVSDEILFAALKWHPICRRVVENQDYSGWPEIVRNYAWYS